jgi:hypothetical protein
MLSVCLPASAFLASFMIDADNLDILRFANSFFPLSALNGGRKCRFADADDGTGLLLRRFRCSREDAGAANLRVYSTEVGQWNCALLLYLL